jgi:membrane dipeptidase
MRVRLAMAVVSTVVSMSASTAAQVPADTFLERARALHRQVPVIDGHNDYPWEVRQRAGGDPAKLDIRGPQPATMTDIPRLREGGVGAQFWSAYTPPSMAGPEAVAVALEQIDIVYRMVARYPEVFELARTADDIERIVRSGRIASLIGVEGGHAINSSLGVLRMYAQLGARYMTLTHSKNVAWADSATDTPRHRGLTPFGEDVIREMNRLGLLVDLSHVSTEVMEHALRVSTAPVVFTHSSARALCDSPRNVPDTVLRELKQNGGVVMVSFVPSFTTPEALVWENAYDAERDRLGRMTPGTEASFTQAVEAWKAGHPRPVVSVAQVADHIDHIRRIVGIDHVGYGSDFDGITKAPSGLEDVSKFPALTAELLRRGYSDQEVKQVLGLNLLRIMRAAESVARQNSTR